MMFKEVKPIYISIQNLLGKRNKQLFKVQPRYLKHSQTNVHVSVRSVHSVINTTEADLLVR